MVISKITKLETGIVQFLDSDDNIVVSLAPKASISGVGTYGLEINDITGTKVILTVSNITQTKLDPAAAVPFSGDIQDLWTLLSSSFFSSTGMPAISTDDVLNTSSVSGATATGAFNRLKQETRMVIKTMADFLDNYPEAGGVITLPSGVYLIDATNLDFTGYTFVSTGNISFQGYSQAVNKMSSTSDGITAFTVTGGGLNINELTIEVTGIGSKVMQLNGTATEAMEIINSSFSNSTEWGVLDNIRQVFIQGFFSANSTRGFLISTALSGLRFADSLVVNCGEYIAKGDTGLTIGNVRSNINAVIPASAVAFDFDYNMLSDNSYLLKDGFYNGDGQMVADFTTGDNTEAEKSRRSLFDNNQGTLRKNTTVGGYWDLTLAVVTPIVAIDTYVKLQGTTIYRDLQHFTTTDSNAFIYSASTPVVFEISGTVTLESTQGDTVTLVVRHWDASKAKFGDLNEISQEIVRLQGARDIAQYSPFARIELEENDRIELHAKNETGTNDITMEGGSRLLIKKL